MEKNIKVNPLPSRTWHWLRMNETQLKLEIPEAGPSWQIRGPFSDAPCHADRPEHEIVWRPLAPRQGACPGVVVDAVSETGMGAEFDAAMSDTPAAFLKSPEGYHPSAPTVLTCTTAAAAAGRLLIRAARDSELSIVLLLAGGESLSEDADPTLSLQVKVYAEENASVSLSLVQLLPSRALSLIDLGAAVEEGASFSLTELCLGSARQLAGIAVELRGAESCFTGGMGYRVSPYQNVDINYVARHRGLKSESTMNAWGILEEGAHKLFRGTIDFITGCAGAKGAEKEEVLLLGDKQVNQTIHLILCQEEDVEGDHGATISRLDEQVLFYLGTRGICGKAAEDMIAQARLEALCCEIPDEAVRSMAEAAIHAASSAACADFSSEEE